MWTLVVTVPRSLGISVSVTIEGTSSVYKLPIAPLITGSHPVDNKGYVNVPYFINLPLNYIKSASMQTRIEDWLAFVNYHQSGK